MKTKVYRFHITPQTHVRATQGDRIFFKIPRDKLQPSGLRRLMRLERYNNYKSDLLELSRKLKFDFPSQGAQIRFYIPCPKSWTKKKKLKYHGTLHSSRPDIDNCLKALLDSLFTEDKFIGHLEVSKHWVFFETGWIEIQIQEPVFPAIPHPSKIVKGAA